VEATGSPPSLANMIECACSRIRLLSTIVLTGKITIGECTTLVFHKDTSSSSFLRHYLTTSLFNIARRQVKKIRRLWMMV
jgi:hypothetical protein